MANNYMQFSEEIEQLTDEEIKFFQEVCSYEPPLDLYAGWEPPAWYDVDSGGLGFSAEVDEGTRELWVYAEEFGNLDMLVALILEFIQKFRPEYIFTLSYAETCSKMRVGEFGGGALIISREGSKFINTCEWLSHREAEIQEARGKV